MASRQDKIPPFPIPFPILGIDRGTAAVDQTPGTTRELRNVRALQVGDQVGGGKRPGLKRAFDLRLGTASARTINHLAMLRQTTDETPDSEGPGAFPEFWHPLALGGRTKPGFKDPDTDPNVFGLTRIFTYPDAWNLNFIGNVDKVAGDVCERYGRANLVDDDWEIPDTSALDPVAALDQGSPSGMVVYDEKLYFCIARDPISATGLVFEYDQEDETITNRTGIANGGSLRFRSLAVYPVSGVDKLWVGGYWPGSSFPGDGVAYSGGDGSWSAGDGAGITTTEEGVYAMAVFNACLYVAGSFASIDGKANTAKIAKYNGTSWVSVTSDAINGAINTLKVFDGKLYVGGEFTSIGADTDYSLIASLTTADAWGKLNNGLRMMATIDSEDSQNQGVLNLETWHDGIKERLWAVGLFDGASTTAHNRGIGCPNIVAWDGSDFTAPIRGFARVPRCTYPAGADLIKKLYVAGTHNRANMRTANGIGQYPTSDFNAAPLGGMRSNRDAGAQLARLDIDTIPRRSALCSAALTSDSDFPEAKLYVSIAPPTGEQQVYGFGTGQVTDEIAAYFQSDADDADTEEWEDMASGFGIGLSARALTASDIGGDMKLYCTGDFADCDGGACLGFARWTGSAWEANIGDLGDTGGNATGYVILEHLGVLWIGGDFLNARTAAGGDLTNNDYLTKFNGTDMVNITSAFRPNNPVHTMCLHEGDLIIGGAFTTIGGSSVRRIARFDGTTWSQVGDGFDNGIVKAVASYNGRIYAGGSMTTINGLTGLDYLSRFNGTNWTYVNSGKHDSPDAQVFALHVFDAGTDGPELYVAGSFRKMGSKRRPGIFKTDRTSWRKVVTDEWEGVEDQIAGQQATVNALTTHNGKLIFAGNFRGLGGNSSPEYLAWGAPVS